MNPEDIAKLCCSFCGKSQREVRKLIAGPTVYICDECIGLCNDIIAEEIDREDRGDLGQLLLTRAKILAEAVRGLMSLDQPTVAGLPRPLQEAIERVGVASRRLQTTLAECLPQISTAPGARPVRTEQTESDRTAGLSVVLRFLTFCVEVLVADGDQRFQRLSAQQVQALDDVRNALNPLVQLVNRHLVEAFGTEAPRD